MELIYLNIYFVLFYCTEFYIEIVFWRREQSYNKYNVKTMAASFKCARFTIPCKQFLVLHKALYFY